MRSLEVVKKSNFQLYYGEIILKMRIIHYLCGIKLHSHGRCKQNKDCSRREKANE